jgi:hypothetical protein
VPKAILLSHAWFQNCFKASMGELSEKFIDFSNRTYQNADFYHIGFSAFVDKATGQATSKQESALENKALKAFLADIIPISLTFDHTSALTNGRKVLFNALMKEDNYHIVQSATDGYTFYSEFELANPVNYLLHNLKGKKTETLIACLSQSISDQISIPLALTFSYLKFEVADGEDFLFPEELAFFINLFAIEINRLNDDILGSLEDILAQIFATREKIKIFNLILSTELRNEFSSQIVEIGNRLDGSIYIIPHHSEIIVSHPIQIDISNSY